MLAMLSYMGLAFMTVSQGNGGLSGVVRRMLATAAVLTEMPFPFLHLLIFGLTIAILLVASVAIQKQRKTMKIQKKMFFNLFSSFQHFQRRLKKNLNFQTRSTFHASFLKSLIFLIESTFSKNTRKIKIYKKNKGKDKERKS